MAPVLEQVMRMMSLLAQEKGTELTYRMEENCRVSATKGEVHQVIYNLTDNAVKYSGKNGKVRVELRHEDRDVVLTASRRRICQRCSSGFTGWTRPAPVPQAALVWDFPSFRIR